MARNLAVTLLTTAALGAPVPEQPVLVSTPSLGKVAGVRSFALKLPVDRFLGLYYVRATQLEPARCLHAARTRDAQHRTAQLARTFSRRQCRRREISAGSLRSPTSATTPSMCMLQTRLARGASSLMRRATRRASHSAKTAFTSTSGASHPTPRIPAKRP